MKNYSLILGLIGIVVLTIFWNSFENKPDCDEFLSQIRSERYSGIIIKKFIDKDQHNYKKVILKKDSKTQVILLDQEEGGLFEYLEKGDSISKKGGELILKIVREEKDSIYKLNYYCLTQKGKK